MADFGKNGIIKKGKAEQVLMVKLGYGVKFCASSSSILYHRSHGRFLLGYVDQEGNRPELSCRDLERNLGFYTSGIFYGFDHVKKLATRIDLLPRLDDGHSLDDIHA